MPKTTPTTASADESAIPLQTLNELIQVVKAMAGSNSLSKSPLACNVLDETVLAARWNISKKTLQRWRFWGTGPRHLKLGRKVVYLISDVEAFERQSTRTSTSERFEG